MAFGIPSGTPSAVVYGVSIPPPSFLKRKIVDSGLPSITPPVLGGHPSQFSARPSSSIDHVEQQKLEARFAAMRMSEGGLQANSIYHGATPSARGGGARAGELRCDPARPSQKRCALLAIADGPTEEEQQKTSRVASRAWAACGTEQGGSLRYYISGDGAVYPPHAVLQEQKLREPLGPRPDPLRSLRHAQSAFAGYISPERPLQSKASVQYPNQNPYAAACAPGPYWSHAAPPRSAPGVSRNDSSRSLGCEPVRLLKMPEPQAQMGAAARIPERTAWRGPESLSRTGDAARVAEHVAWRVPEAATPSMAFSTEPLGAAALKTKPTVWRPDDVPLLVQAPVTAAGFPAYRRRSISRPARPSVSRKAAKHHHVHREDVPSLVSSALRAAAATSEALTHCHGRSHMSRRWSRSARSIATPSCAPAKERRGDVVNSRRSPSRGGSQRRSAAFVTPRPCVRKSPEDRVAPSPERPRKARRTSRSGLTRESSVCSTELARSARARSRSRRSTAGLKKTAGRSMTRRSDVAREKDDAGCKKRSSPQASRSPLSVIRRSSSLLSRRDSHNLGGSAAQGQTDKDALDTMQALLESVRSAWQNGLQSLDRVEGEVHEIAKKVGLSSPIEAASEAPAPRDLASPPPQTPGSEADVGEAEEDRPADPEIGVAATVARSEAVEETAPSESPVDHHSVPACASPPPAAGDDEDVDIIQGQEGSIAESKPADAMGDELDDEVDSIKRLLENLVAGKEESIPNSPRSASSGCSDVLERLSQLSSGKSVAEESPFIPSPTCTE